MATTLDQTEDLGSREPEKRLPFLVHLEELRRRLLKSVIAVVIMAGGAFYFREQIMAFLTGPFGDQRLHNMEVTGAFYAYLKISLLVGILASLPIVFYQMWAFISPGLYRRERSTILPLVIVSTFLFLLGAGFCYLTVLPLALKWLIGFSGEFMINTITISSYISFVGLLLLAFGASFQLPVIAYFLGRLGVLNSTFLAKGRRYAIVVILIVAAIITPPDVFTQILLAGPMYILYEISILTVRFTGRAEDRG